MADQPLTINNVAVPRFLYGTAWKEDATEQLTTLALEAGFRGIDTANQRKHYYEEGVGRAIQAALDSGRISREELFLQTKFTFMRGQDHRLPYDSNASISTQVEQSFASSLEHLGVNHIDSYVLHGPTFGRGIHDNDMEAWKAIEGLFEGGAIRLVGVSNVSLDQLQTLYKTAGVKPAFVQNRCYAATGWDYEVRRFCSENDVIYQGFSLLTANRGVWQGAAVAALAAKYSRTPAQVIFRFCIDAGMLPLTGTSDPDHMQEDLNVAGWNLEKDEILLLQSIGVA
ncbi:MAG: aldo/keto reductase [Planctomycetota bacterium]